MIFTLLKDNIVLRYIDCSSIDIAMLQCEEGETIIKGLLNETPSIIPSKVKNVNKIHRDFEAGIELIGGDCSQNERSTWTKQESEARAWLLNNDVSTPFIDAMLSSRSDHTKESLVNKIIEKADLYAMEVGKLLGEKQKQEKALLDSSVTKE